MYVALAGSLLLHGTGVHGRGIEYRHGISLVHDLKYGADFEHFDYFDPGAPKGGVIRLPTKLDITNFTWYFDTVVNPAEGLERTYDSLLIRSGDELSSFYGLLADGVAVSEDRRFLYLRLNPDARWHDGAPVTVDDVKYTLDEAVDTLDGQIYLPWLRATEIAGERELVLRHSNGFTDANIAVVTSLPILPRLHWEGRDPTKVHPAPTRIERSIPRRCLQPVACSLRPGAGLLGCRSAGQSRPPQLRPDPLRGLSRRHRRARGIPQGAARRARRGRHAPLAFLVR